MKQPRRSKTPIPSAQVLEPEIAPTRQGVSVMRDEAVWNWAVRISVVGLFVIAAGVSLKLLAHIAVPLVLAWVIATVLLPLVQLLVQVRIPRPLSAILLIAAVLAVIAAILTILTVPLSYWVSRADELGQLLRDKLVLIQQPLEMLEALGRALNPVSDDGKPPVFVNAPTSNMVNSLLEVLTPAVDEFMIFVIALAFNLIYQREIQDGVVMLVPDGKAKALTRTALRDVQHNMSNYFGTVTVINIFVGVATAGIAAMLGFPHPLLWGVFAAVMNYIPYLGPLLVLGVFFVIGVVVFPTLHEPILAPLLFLALNTLEGQVITPAFVGHRLTINPFLVFVSIAFWTWLWGPLGAFLAVPLLVTAMVAARHISGARRVPAD
jgi:predicted PurR-regulated permease PerM